MPMSAPRREGFAGQHLVVLPAPLRERAKRHGLLRGLHVTDAGYFPTAADHEVDRPHGSPTTLVILCLRGEGWFQVDGKRHGMGPGDLVWLPARQAHAYGASAHSPWTIVWAHFEGEECASWLEFLHACAGSREMLLPVAPDHVDEVALERVFHALERGQSIRHQIAAACALRWSLSKAGEILVERHGPRSARERVADSLRQLREDSSQPCRLEELASRTGMSVTHYCAHFRQLAGFAPIDFLIRQRVQQACHWLDTSQLTVAEIAARVGYPDPYYFTRCFRRVMGCSPREYRKVPKG